MKVAGTLDAVEAGCAAFEAPGYDFQRYLADYDPAVWGYENEVSGPQEELRAASAAAQGRAIKVKVPANTTLVGVGRDAAQLIFNRFAGQWEVTEYLRNAGAVSFWRRVISAYTRGTYTERISDGEVRQLFRSAPSPIRA